MSSRYTGSLRIPTTTVRTPVTPPPPPARRLTIKAKTVVLLGWPVVELLLEMNPNRVSWHVYNRSRGSAILGFAAADLSNLTYGGVIVGANGGTAFVDNRYLNGPADHEVYAVQGGSTWTTTVWVVEEVLI